MTLTFATFTGFTPSMMIAETIRLNIQLIFNLRVFVAKVIITMFITKFFVTVTAAVGAAAGPTEHTSTDVG